MTRLPAQPTVFSAITALALAALSPSTMAQVDPGKLVDAFERAGGKFDGFRRSGAKGGLRHG